VFARKRPVQRKTLSFRYSRDCFNLFAPYKAGLDISLQVLTKSEYNHTEELYTLVLACLCWILVRGRGSMHNYGYADWTLYFPKNPAPHVLSFSDGKRLPQTLQSFGRQQRQLEKSSTQLYINSTLPLHYPANSTPHSFAHAFTNLATIPDSIRSGIAVIVALSLHVWAVS
jgi:hypothetical protein